MMDLETYGKYVLLERLAAGGMGEVFLARAGAKGYERLFALKRILAQHAESPEFTQMLMNEARISVMLVHPNIAQVFEFGQLDQCFPEFRPFLGQCKFADCSHEHEPGCAILAAIERGEVSRDRHESYLKLRAELSEAERVW